MKNRVLIRLSGAQSKASSVGGWKKGRTRLAEVFLSAMKLKEEKLYVSITR